MKRLFKKAMMTIAGVLTMCLPEAASAKAIMISEFPAVAQKMLKQNFSGHKVAMSTMDYDLFSKSYDVVFTNGDKVEFDSEGNWKEVKCKQSSVSKALIPQGIKEYLKHHYTNAIVKEIERYGNKHEVKLSNGLEITFDKDFRVIDIDD